jgi:drug/metabolite transporter (DMT)-like permease
MKGPQIAALLFVSGVWGASFLFIRVLIDAGVEPLGISAGRTILGTVALLPFGWYWRRHIPRERRTLAVLAGLGILNFALPWTLFGVAQGYISSGTASIGNAAMPLWTAIFATMLIREERLTVLRVSGLCFGFAGVALLAAPGAGGLGGDPMKGVPIVVAATMCYAVSTVTIRKQLHGVHASMITLGQIGVAATVLVPLAALTGAYSGADMQGREYVSLAILGLLGSGTTVMAYMWLIGQVGPVRASVVTYLIPPTGVFLGWLLLDESIGWNMVAGIALILAGVASVQGLVRHVLSLWERRPPAVPGAVGK